jgi:hypothetical protein
MKFHRFFSIVVCVLFMASVDSGIGAMQATSPRQATEEEVGLFLTHLREHFDDIHDVSMRFHAQDPSISGTVVLELVWNEGRLIDARVISNDTGNEAEGPAMIEAIRPWRIDALQALDVPVRMTIPLRIRLVGSDDPDFPHRAILTGTVRDAAGRPVHRARVEFSARDSSLGPVPPARTSREGIFVRTLIPPGSWDISCVAEGHAPVVLDNVELTAGQHRIEEFTLRPQEEMVRESKGAEVDE